MRAVMVRQRGYYHKVVVRQTYSFFHLFDVLPWRIDPVIAPQIPELPIS